jgi:hypothetical protein
VSGSVLVERFSWRCCAVRCRVVFASFAGAMLVAVPHASSAADESVLTLLGTYTTGLADIEDESPRARSPSYGATSST